MAGTKISDDLTRATTIPPELLLEAARKLPRGQSGTEYALIRSNSHPTLPLIIHNYTRDTESRSKWDPLTLTTRGLITESHTGRVIARSFPKFFNFHEKPAYKPTGFEYAHVIEEKLDGSIIMLFNYAGKWEFASRGSFNSTHVDWARGIYDEKYKQNEKSLDKEKTYVFELLHPENHVGVHYGSRRDLVLLTTFTKDGQEPPAEYDWSTAPFPRPKIHKVSNPNAPLNLTALQKLNLNNEEGFIVKYFRTKTDTRPQRLKVKFETYLAGRLRGMNVTGEGVLEEYKSARKKIWSFSEGVVRGGMAEARRSYIGKIEAVKDDVGEEWVRQAGLAWDAIHEVFTDAEAKWRAYEMTFLREGFKPRKRVGKAGSKEKSRFSMRIRGSGGLPQSYWPLAHIWFGGVDEREMVATFVKIVEVPKELLDKVRESVGSTKD